MLRTLTDALHASLTPEGANLVHLRKGLQPRVIGKWPSPETAALAEEPWRAGIQQLGLLLDQAKQRLPLSVVLSNRLVRYLILPAPRPFMAERDRQALLRHSFGEIYGETVDGWMTRLTTMPDGNTAVASSIDAALLQALQSLCVDRAITLHSVQPDFMACFNQARALVRGKATCFVQAEPGHCLIGLIRDNTWLSLNAMPFSGELQHALPVLVRREMLLCGWEGRDPQIVLSTHDGRVPAMPNQPESWVMHYVPPRSAGNVVPGRDQPFAMALRGI